MTLESLTTSKISTWGGSREGSGRKPRLQYEARELFNAVIDHEWDRLLETLLDQARNGDKDVLRWLIEQRIGKAPQSLDIEAKGAFLNMTEPIDTDGAERVRLIAGRVAEELKKIKTG